MAGGQKRTSEETTGPVTRAKAVKTNAEDSASAKVSSTSGRQSGRVSASVAAFRAQALPLHVNITHTPPVVGDSDTTDVAQLDPGFIGSTALVPSTFNTGSYGWKGSKHITIELQNNETGKKEKVSVQLTINATVLDRNKPETNNSEEADITASSNTTDTIA